jgi:hypothetical protein
MIKSNKKLLFIATSSFNVRQNNTLKILKKKKLLIKFYSTGKKLSENQLLSYAKNAIYIRSYAKEVRH